MATIEATIAIVGGAGPLVSEGLSWVLSASGSRVLGSYPDVDALEDALRAGGHSLQAAVIDAEDPSAGPSAVTALRRAHPDLKIVLLCEVASRAVVACAVSERVEGVVLKSDTPEQVILALRNVLDGRAVMPASWHKAPLEREGTGGALSERERQVLDLAAQGLTNREIAERLVISTNTVKYHLRGIYSSLGVRNRVQASRAMSEGEGDGEGERARISDRNPPEEGEPHPTAEHLE